MTKFRSVKSALITSVVSLFLCVAMLLGTTFAWFTDSITSGQNVIQSGKLDIKLEYSVLENGVWTDYAEVTNTTDIFGYNNWEPGYVSVAKFRISNIGTLALKYSLTADVYEETPGINVNGDEFFLSDYLYTEVVDVDATREEILASTTGSRLKAPINDNHIVNDDLIVSRADVLEENEVKEVALAIWMPTTVGNEANYRDVQPSITFGINLIAAQTAFESDSYSTTYDSNATFPLIAWASAPVDANATNVELDLLLATGAKVGSMDIPTEAIDPDAKNVTVTVKETVVDENVQVAADEEAKTFEVTVTNIKAGNTAAIKVTLDVGAGLTGVRLFHNDVEVTPIDYNSTTGAVTFYTTSFSPYTVIYDAVAVEENVEDLEDTVPVATVTQQPTLENQPIEWKGWGGYNPSDLEQQLNAVYLFQSPHTSETVEDSLYRDWYCDYYVMLETADPAFTTLNESSIALGGNYGGYGWVGFDNPTVETNTYIPLLASAIGRDENATWTYEAVCDFVQEFWCGVGVVEGSATNLDGAKFVVELRLTNPENTDEYIVCNKVVYNFTTGESVITNYNMQ